MANTDEVRFDADAVDAIASTRESSGPTTGNSEELETSSLPIAAQAFASAFVQQVVAIAKLLTGLQADVRMLVGRLAPLPTADPLHAEFLDRYRALSEQFHEREVLQPIFRALIGIADRYRQQEQELQKRIDQLSENSDGDPRIKPLRERKSVRNGDRLEIENILAILGVESFQTPGPRFDPATQKCLRTITSGNGYAPGQIAQRLLPGYRRGERIVRQEYVNVVVKAPELSKGDQTCQQ